MKILFIGPQGAGKSTQGKLLAEYLNLPYISTGDIFRGLDSSSEDGQRIKLILSEGKLVDDKTTSKIIEKKLQDPDFINGFILDGYPRTLEQINFFDPLFDKVFYLKLSDEEALKRLLLRGREDDTEELISQRLKNYHEYTDPIIDYYNQKGLLTTLDGTGTVLGIQEDLKKSVNE